MNHDAIAQSMQLLRELLGSWHGTGRGGFPTIDEFTYDEELVFTSDAVEPVISYEQKTWDTTHRCDHAEPLHWEVGFIRPTEDGCVELSNAQNGGRVEVLRGRLTQSEERGGSLLLTLDSVLVGHDERIIRTRRRYQIAPATLRCHIEMATRSTPILTTHLRASLQKRQPTPAR